VIAESLEALHGLCLAGNIIADVELDDFVPARSPLFRTSTDTTSESRRGFLGADTLRFA